MRHSTQFVPGTQFTGSGPLRRAAAAGLAGLLLALSAPPHLAVAATATDGAGAAHDDSAVADPAALAGRPARCGTHQASAAEAAEIEERIERFRANLPAPDAGKAAGTIAIRVYVHVINAGAGIPNGDLPDSMIDEQIRVLNEAFGGATGGAPTPFRFVLHGVTRTTNATWFRSLNSREVEIAAKTALRVPGANVLNIYTADIVEAGWSFNPWDVASNPTLDGVVCDFDTLPGGRAAAYDEGDTAVHETGHWLGLYHTFEFGCDFGGDVVDDTPAVAMPNYGCTPTDSCPADPGADAIENFMDYADDSCMWAFSPGQASRMDVIYAMYRDFGGDDVALTVDGRDIALTGAPEWASVPVAAGNGDGSFIFVNGSLPDFAYWASQGAVKVAGDFDGDGKTDIALTGVAGWASIPVATARGNGTFRVTNRASQSFAWLAAQPGVAVLCGDFNGDGRDDIALAGGPGWGSVPVAFSTGGGYFTVRNLAIGPFAEWAAQGSKKLVGDFNGDGRDDIALTGVSWWQSVPVAFSNGNGTFTVSNATTFPFAEWSASGAAKLVGDYNGDGRADIALTGVEGWASVPVAFSNGNGTFTVTNTSVDRFPYFATRGATKIAGDFDGDGDTDLALAGAQGWASVPVAFSNGDGSFSVTNWPTEAFAWLASQGATVLAGDFDSDGRTDLALTGVEGWESIPVAFSNGNGTFRFTNSPIPSFGQLATHPRATKVTGRYR